MKATAYDRDRPPSLTERLDAVRGAAEAALAQGVVAAPMGFNNEGFRNFGDFKQYARP